MKWSTLFRTVLFFIGCVASLAGNSQTSKSLQSKKKQEIKSGITTISGQIKNITSKSIQLILEEDINRKKSKLIAEIPVNTAGQFKFEKKLPPHIYRLQIPEGKSVTIALDKSQNIILSGNATGPEQLKVTGSADTDKLQAYEKFRKESLDRLVISVRNQIRSLKEKGTPDDNQQLADLTKAEVENYELHKDELIDFIRKNMGLSPAVYATSIRWGGEKNIPFLKDLAARFEAAHPNTDIAKRINEKVKVISQNAIGGKAADIRMTDTTGKIVALNTVDARYILIDFWASWCAPCRRESGLLGELYQKYKSDGFEIYGVGLESSKETWVKAIQKDKRTWINVSSLQQFETPAAYEYAVTALPANVLIDRSGQIVARNLHGNDLKKIVETLFANKL